MVHTTRMHHSTISNGTTFVVKFVPVGWVHMCLRLVEDGLGVIELALRLEPSLLA